MCACGLSNARVSVLTQVACLTLLLFILNSIIVSTDKFRSLFIPPPQVGPLAEDEKGLFGGYAGHLGRGSHRGVARDGPQAQVAVAHPAGRVGAGPAGVPVAVPVSA